MGGDRGQVLVVDDEPLMRRILVDLLRPDGFRVAEAVSGPEALRQAATLDPDVILLDIMMPGMDGLEVLRRLRSDSAIAEIPVVVVTSLDDHDTRIAALDNGADDIISKPFDRAELRARIRTITRLNRYRKLRQAHQEVTLAYDATLEAWVRLLDMRDKETAGHSERVTNAAVALASAAGLSAEEIVHVRRGALLHDLGKIVIPDAILHKPGRLDADEMAVMKAHPRIARDLMCKIPYLIPAMDIPSYHHERYDGQGYPYGLAGTAIPLTARLFAVIDVWDALSNERPYKAAWPRPQVLDYLRQMAGTQFDPDAVRLFLTWEQATFGPSPASG